MKAFKAYDIRGVFGSELTEELAYKVGYFLPRLLDAKTILVGRDMRVSSPVIYENLTKGILDANCDVLDISLASTPMVYFATVYYKVDGSVQITASHNPGKYNGLKISRKMAIPVGGETGLKQLEEMCEKEGVVISDKKGSLKKVDAKTPYLEFLNKYKEDYSKLKIAVDCSNGMSSLLVKEVLGDDAIYINDVLDGTFPNHEPNPLDPNNCKQLQDTVVNNGCDLGIIFDGDADRVMFIDEKGGYIPADHLMGLLGEKMLEMEGERIAVVDIRTSKSTTEHLEKLGYKVIMWKVGHVHAKAKLRETGAVFGGELAGHYYFREFNNCDSGLFAMIMMLNLISKKHQSGKTLSSLISDIVRYVSSGEINFKVENKDEVIDIFKNTYAPKADKVLDTDGYRIEFKSWWFGIRKSNTEPYLRLVAEASSQKELDEKVAQITEIIKANSK
ncbi:MAG: phosphomannomutase/phosphoglucomutase [Pleomorphochaeta sp.]